MFGDEFFLYHFQHKIPTDHRLLPVQSEEVYGMRPCDVGPLHIRITGSGEGRA